MSSGKWRPSCLGLIVLRGIHLWTVDYPQKGLVTRKISSIWRRHHALPSRASWRVCWGSNLENNEDRKYIVHLIYAIPWVKLTFFSSILNMKNMSLLAFHTARWYKIKINIAHASCMYELSSRHISIFIACGRQYGVISDRVIARVHYSNFFEWFNRRLSAQSRFWSRQKAGFGAVRLGSAQDRFCIFYRSYKTGFVQKTDQCKTCIVSNTKIDCVYMNKYIYIHIYI